MTLHSAVCCVKGTSLSLSLSLSILTILGVSQGYSQSERPTRKSTHWTYYTDYTVEIRTQIGKYAAESGLQGTIDTDKDRQIKTTVLTTLPKVVINTMEVDIVKFS